MSVSITVWRKSGMKRHALERPFDRTSAALPGDTRFGQCLPLFEIGQRGDPQKILFQRFAVSKIVGRADHAAANVAPDRPGFCQWNFRESLKNTIVLSNPSSAAACSSTEMVSTNESWPAGRSAGARHRRTSASFPPSRRWKARVGLRALCHRRAPPCSTSPSSTCSRCTPARNRSSPPSCRNFRTSFLRISARRQTAAQSLP